MEDFELRTSRGIVLEDHEGSVLQDIEFIPGAKAEEEMLGSIHEAIGLLPVPGQDSWDMCTQFHFLPDLGREQNMRWLYPVLADAGTPLQIRVIYLPAGGSLSVIKMEMAKLARDMDMYFPNCRTEVGLGEMPFEEDVSHIGSYFDRNTFQVKN